MKWVLFLMLLTFPLRGEVKVGAECFFENGAYKEVLGNKRVGLISNQTAVDRHLRSTFDLLMEHSKEYQVTALFAPEHGFFGNSYAGESLADERLGTLPIYSLHGAHRRPTQEMLDQVDILIYDIQDIGSRSYTFISTLFYCMEEAARHKIPLIVLDRPNPIGGHIVDGPLMEARWRSFVGYVNVPYCYGMTIGELACLFNEEEKIGCALTVIQMEGYQRTMSFNETQLTWVPTSPQIPEAWTAFYYPATGLLGELSLVSIGIGYTEPFKLIGAPWIDSKKFANKLKEQKLPGVTFQPCTFRPFFGKFEKEECQGVRIMITNQKKFLPVTTQYTILGVLKQLYPQKVQNALQEIANSESKKEFFYKLTGSEEVFRLLSEEKYCIWKLRAICQQGRRDFLEKRKKYLFHSYS